MEHLTSESRIERREVPIERQDKQSLEDDKVIELARLGKRIERVVGSYDINVEFCYSKKKIWILQVRLIFPRNFVDLGLLKERSIPY